MLTGMEEELAELEDLVENVDHPTVTAAATSASVENVREEDRSSRMQAGTVTDEKKELKSQPLEDDPIN